MMQPHGRVQGQNTAPIGECWHRAQPLSGRVQKHIQLGSPPVGKRGSSVEPLRRPQIYVTMRSTMGERRNKNTAPVGECWNRAQPPSGRVQKHIQLRSPPVGERGNSVEPLRRPQIYMLVRSPLGERRNKKHSPQWASVVTEQSPPVGECRNIYNCAAPLWAPSWVSAATEGAAPPGRARA